MAVSTLRPTIQILASLLEDERVTDVHLHADKPVRIRHFGRLEALTTEKIAPLKQEEIEQIIHDTMDNPLTEGLEGASESGVDERSSFYRKSLDGATGGASYAFAYEGETTTERRVRATAFRARGKNCLSLRLLPAVLPDWDTLGLPAQWAEFLGLDRGLVLVCGKQGEGKSTTCASLVEQICRLYKRNILTLEDPIEYIFTDGQSLVAQREIGDDFDRWESGLHLELRQDINVLFCGELRTPEAVLTALEAAETSQLVFTTLHANGAPDAIERIVEMFPDSRSSMIRAQLARVLTASICQWLVPAVGGEKRALAYEVLVCRGDTAVSAHIREGRVMALRDLMHSNRDQGMCTIEQSLEELVRKNRVQPQVAERFVAGFHRARANKNL